MTTHTLTALRQLKLGGMAHALQSQLEQVGTYEELAFIERLALLVEQETLSRDQRIAEKVGEPGQEAEDGWQAFFVHDRYFLYGAQIVFFVKPEEVGPFGKKARSGGSRWN